MFFGPFLPIVPFMMLLEYLPDCIGEPLQTALTDAWYYLITEFDGLFFLFK